MSSPTGEDQGKLEQRFTEIVQQKVSRLTTVRDLLLATYGKTELTPTQLNELRYHLGKYPNQSPEELVSGGGMGFYVKSWGWQLPGEAAPPPGEADLYIQARLTAPPAGDSMTLLAGRNADAAEMLKMADPASTTNVAVRVVWSGGAGDCVIVGGYQAGRARLMHMDQTCVGADFGSMAGWQIYLASGKFARTGGMQDDRLVRDLVAHLKAVNADVRAIYASSQLAIDVDGHVFAAFDVGPLKRDVYNITPKWTT